ncbi:MAG: HlyD family efflux transporter periplasmic adaptor subunit [Candidatus Magasanikbacteria bacterium]
MEEQNIQKKKWYRRKWFYIALSVVLVLVVAGMVSSVRNGKPQYETTKVQKGNLVQTVDATGNVSSANELELRFETAGRIGKIYKQVNDEVKAGDVIIELELRELNGRVAQASAGVQRAQANLDKVLKGQTDSYLSNLKAKLEQSQATSEQVRATSADAVANADAALKTAENDLKLSEGGENSEVVQDAYDDMVAIFQTTLNILNDALTQADNILGVDNTLANDEFESVLSALNSGKLSTAKNEYYQAKASKAKADMWSTIGANSTKTEIDSATSIAEMALVDARDMLFAVSETLNATIPIGDLSQSELDALKTGIQTVRTSVSTQYTSVINQKQAINTARNSYSSFQVAYAQAQINFENAKQKAIADVAAYQALVDQAQSTYNDAVNPPRVEDVNVARAQVLEAQGSLAQAVAARDKARIIAPIAGMIGKLDGKVGEYASAQDVAVKLVNPHFEVKVDIPETDIIKVAIGNIADITLDAFGDDVHFKGSVIQIEKGETIIQDVVYYTVTVSLESDTEHTILNGMTANVVFNTEEKQNALFIPQRVIKIDGSKKTVRVLENEEIKEVEVTTGLRGDNGLIEIVSGLSEGQDVVVREIEK